LGSFDFTVSSSVHLQTEKFSTMLKLWECEEYLAGLQ